jgi:hypothetical protein
MEVRTLASVTIEPGGQQWQPVIKFDYLGWAISERLAVDLPSSTAYTNK